mgnify:CR=1 FL=1
MKKLIIATLCFFVATLFNSCGVGNYTVTSGIEDKAAVCFSAASAYDIAVTIDGQQYATKTVKDIARLFYPWPLPELYLPYFFLFMMGWESIA